MASSRKGHRRALAGTQQQQRQQVFREMTTEKKNTLQADPTQAELLNKQFSAKKAKLQGEVKSSILEKYGGAEHLESLPKVLFFFFFSVICFLFFILFFSLLKKFFGGRSLLGTFVRAIRAIRGVFANGPADQGPRGGCCSLEIRGRQ